MSASVSAKPGKPADDSNSLLDGSVVPDQNSVLKPARLSFLEIVGCSSALRVNSD